MERKRIGEQLRTKERDTKNDQGISTPLADGYKQTKRDRESITGSERQQRKRHKELEKCERIDSKRGRELVNREQKRER